MDEARISLDDSGAIIDANQAALELYRLTLAELRAAPPGAFAAEPQPIEEQEAFRQNWEASGRPDMVGVATLRRLDGTTVRVRFGITAQLGGTYLAVLRPIDEPTAAPAEVFTAGEVLSRWRAAERDLQAIPPASPEASAIQLEIDRFRQAYQQVFQAARGGDSPA